MKYTLSDGRELDLSRVVEVSSIRDEGIDPNSISMSRIAFQIQLKRHETISVHRSYHFSDWAEVKIELEKERKRLLEQLKAFRSGTAD